MTGASACGGGADACGIAKGEKSSAKPRRPSARPARGKKANGPEAAIPATRSVNPCAPVRAERSSQGVSIRRVPEKPRESPSAPFRARPPPASGAARITMRAGRVSAPRAHSPTPRAAQKSASPPANSTSAKGAIQPWRAASTKKGSTIQCSVRRSTRQPRECTQRPATRVPDRATSAAMQARPRGVAGHKVEGRLTQARHHAGQGRDCHCAPSAQTGQRQGRAASFAHAPPADFGHARADA
jgi:hypothetical protein